MSSANKYRNFIVKFWNPKNPIMLIYIRQDRIIWNNIQPETPRWLLCLCFSLLSSWAWPWYPPLSWRRPPHLSSTLVASAPALPLWTLAGMSRFAYILLFWMNRIMFITKSVTCGFNYSVREICLYCSESFIVMVSKNHVDCAKS